MPETRTISLPAELCDRVEKKFAQRFGSLEEMLTFVLSEFLRDDAAQADRKEQLMIEQRLKDLGYL